MEIIGIKQAVRDYNQWQGAARVYFDTETGEVWTNVYTAPCWWTEYHNKAIMEVTSKATYAMCERDDKLTTKELRDMCEAACCCPTYPL